MFNIYGILIWASQKPQKFEKKFLVQSSPPPPVKKVPPTVAKFLVPPPVGGGGGNPPHLLTLFGKPWYVYSESVFNILYIEIKHKCQKDFLRTK